MPEFSSTIKVFQFLFFYEIGKKIWNINDKTDFVRFFFKLLIIRFLLRIVVLPRAILYRFIYVRIKRKRFSDNRFFLLRHSHTFAANGSNVIIIKNIHTHTHRMYISHVHLSYSK